MYRTMNQYIKKMSTLNKQYLFKNKQYVLLNRSIFTGIVVALLISAISSHLLKGLENNLNTSYTIAISYITYYTIFGFLYYRDNKKEYLLENGKLDTKRFRRNIIKIAFSVGIAEVVYITTRWLIHFYLLTIGYEHFITSIMAHVSSIAAFVIIINLGVNNKLINPKKYLLTSILVLVILNTPVVTTNSNLFVYGQTESINSNLSYNFPNSTGLNKVKVGDIEIAYKMFGSGDPILLINGYASTLDSWEPSTLKRLASNYTVIVFDNRGIGNTTSGNVTPSVRQFAEDTSGLIKALKIERTNILGHSMGGFIAQELALNHPDQVLKVILYATACRLDLSMSGDPEIMREISNQSGTASERIGRLVPYLFPEQWREHNPSYLQSISKSSEIISNETLNQHLEAVQNWKGTCNQLGSITQPTLVIGGTDDNFIHASNLLLLTKNIPGSWLAQFNSAGHGLMYQYPNSFSSVLLSFLQAP